jgi:SEC-C motif domain protein
MTPPTPASCPCDARRDYLACCGRCHAGTPAADAEALMRSRYSAFALGLADYLLKTWHVSTRPAELDLAGNPAVATRWLGLSIRHFVVIDADHAEVEFVARFRAGGASATRLHERSRFVREEGIWFYLDGTMDPSV